MATNIEIAAYLNDPTLLDRCAVALIKEANTIKNNSLGGTPTSTASERLWARYVLERPKSEAAKALRLVLAENHAATTAQIEGVADTTLETQVSAAVPFLIMARSDLP